MYLLREKWSRQEALLAASLSSFIPWAFILTLIHFLSKSKLSLEMGLAASGFLALLFTGILALVLFLLSIKIKIFALDFFLRKILALALLLSLPLIILTAALPHSFPLNLFCITILQSTILYHKLPIWQQIIAEESVRLEPVFFLTVGFKVVIVALFFIYALAA